MSIVGLFIVLFSHAYLSAARCASLAAPSKAFGTATIATLGDSEVRGKEEEEEVRKEEEETLGSRHMRCLVYANW